MENAKILIVDDEEEILQMLQIVLKKEGFHFVEACVNGSQALRFIHKKVFDLIILDIMLPDMNGFHLCTEIRKVTNAPLFFISANSSDLDKLSGFAYGADDYITKPFNPLEVAARVKVQLNRYLQKNVEEKPYIFDYGYFKVNERAADLLVNGVKVPCSAQIFQLLVFFCKNPNQIFTKEQLYCQVWGDSILTDDNTVMVHIRKLREKIEVDPSRPMFLQTVRGLGYKLTSCFPK